MAMTKTSHLTAIGDALKDMFTRATPLAEHSRVRAVSVIHEGEESIPIGAVGTIVHVIRGGIGYDVEFTSPKHVVISARRSELAPA